MRRPCQKKVGGRDWRKAFTLACCEAILLAECSKGTSKGCHGFVKISLALYPLVANSLEREKDCPHRGHSRPWPCHGRRIHQNGSYRIRLWPNVIIYREVAGRICQAKRV